MQNNQPPTGGEKEGIRALYPPLERTKNKERTSKNTTARQQRNPPVHPLLGPLIGQCVCRIISWPPNMMELTPLFRWNKIEASMAAWRMKTPKRWHAESRLQLLAWIEKRKRRSALLDSMEPIGLENKAKTMPSLFWSSRTRFTSRRPHLHWNSIPPEKAGTKDQIPHFRCTTMEGCLPIMQHPIHRQAIEILLTRNPFGYAHKH